MIAKRHTQDTTEVANDIGEPSDEGTSKESQRPKGDHKAIGGTSSTFTQLDIPDIDDVAEISIKGKRKEPFPLPGEKDGRDNKPIGELEAIEKSSLIKLPTPTSFLGEVIHDEPSQSLRLYLKNITRDFAFYFEATVSDMSIDMATGTSEDFQPMLEQDLAIQMPSPLYSGSLLFRSKQALPTIHSRVGLLFEDRIFSVLTLKTTLCLAGFPHFA